MWYTLYIFIWGGLYLYISRRWVFEQKGAAALGEPDRSFGRPRAGGGLGMDLHAALLGWPAMGRKPKSRGENRFAIPFSLVHMVHFAKGC